jgi:hypothetical protein
MFAKSLVLLSLISAVLANVSITNPVASTSVKGGSAIVRECGLSQQVERKRLNISLCRPWRGSMT